MAGAPVVAIGGILQPEQVRAAAQCDVDGVCVLRAVGEHAATAVPELQRALLAGRAAASGRVRPQMPHPSLEPALR